MEKRELTTELSSAVDVDGVEYNAPDSYFFLGTMITGMPNMFFTMGYANASWTLKADMAVRYLL